jgi:hypothetical protein
MDTVIESHVKSIDDLKEVKNSLILQIILEIGKKIQFVSESKL